MARGRKKKILTLDDQLKVIVSQIEETESKLEELKEQKKGLEEQVKANRLSELDELISDRGLTIDDVKELLEKETDNTNTNEDTNE